MEAVDLDLLRCAMNGADLEEAKCIWLPYFRRSLSTLEREGRIRSGSAAKKESDPDTLFFSRMTPIAAGDGRRRRLQAVAEVTPGGREGRIQAEARGIRAATVRFPVATARFRSASRATQAAAAATFRPPFS